MSFTEDNYLVVRNAIDSKFANFLYQYMLLQRNIAKFKFETKYIPPPIPTIMTEIPAKIN